MPKLSYLQYYRSSSECSGESFDSLSLSSEEGDEDDREICMEQVQQNDRNNEAGYDDYCEQAPNQEGYNASEKEMTNKEDRKQETPGEVVAMEVEYIRS